MPYIGAPIKKVIEEINKEPVTFEYPEGSGDIYTCRLTVGAMPVLEWNRAEISGNNALYMEGIMRMLQYVLVPDEFRPATAEEKKLGAPDKIFVKSEFARFRQAASENSATIDDLKDLVGQLLTAISGNLRGESESSSGSPNTSSPTSSTTSSSNGKASKKPTAKTVKATI